LSKLREILLKLLHDEITVIDNPLTRPRTVDKKSFIPIHGRKAPNRGSGIALPVITFEQNLHPLSLYLSGGTAGNGVEPLLGNCQERFLDLLDLGR
jgi:hypothetical protein